MNLNYFWRLWAKALGEKASSCDRESVKVALIRTLILLTYLITNIAIVSNAIRHWNGKTMDVDINVTDCKPTIDSSTTP